MEIDLKLCNFAAEKASLLGACPQQGVGMKVKNKPWHSLNYTPIVSEFAIKTKEISGIAADFYCLDLVSFLEKCHKFQFLKQPSDSLVSQLKDMIVVANSEKNAVSSQNRVLSTNSMSVGNIGEVKK